jgi:hypothetical protein
MKTDDVIIDEIKPTQRNPINALAGQLIFFQ